MRCFIHRRGSAVIFTPWQGQARRGFFSTTTASLTHRPPQEERAPPSEGGGTSSGVLPSCRAVAAHQQRKAPRTHLAEPVAETRGEGSNSSASRPSRAHAATTPHSEAVSGTQQSGTLPSAQPRQKARRRTVTAIAPATVEAAMKMGEDVEAMYQSTLRKPLQRRHSGPHGAARDVRPGSPADDPMEARLFSSPSAKVDAYDPATVIETDARRGQLHLNPIQKELAWKARQEEYHGMLYRVVATLQSHSTPIEKCHTLLALHEEVIQHRLRLRVDTYEDIFHLYYAVAIRGHARGSLNPNANVHPVAAAAGGGTSCSHPLLLHEESEGGRGGSLLSVPKEVGSVTAASTSVLSPHFVQNLWRMYRYMVDSGTNPSPRVVQYMMGILEHHALSCQPSTSAHHRYHASAGQSHTTLVEAKAHSLIMDVDRFKLTPTEYTVNSYIGVCDVCGVMHLAVARVADYQARHERQASAGMYAKLITGLVHNEQYDLAMSVITTMQSVPFSTQLLNAVLQAARFSRDPASAFTFYRAVLRPRKGGPAGTGRGAGQFYRNARTTQRLAPSLHTFSILVEVMRETGDFAEIDFVLYEMRSYGIKGNGMLLNRLLGALLDARRTKEATALYSAMVAKHIRVFDEHQRRLHFVEEGKEAV